jgi:hypothetical protein
MLAEHGIDNADKGLVGIEQAVAAGQQIAFQPALGIGARSASNPARGLAAPEIHRWGLRGRPIDGW